MEMITAHFAREEFDCRDGTRYPVEWAETRLPLLCKSLEIIRATVNVPLKVLSGYRTETYNMHIGGARLSQHVQGRAADITCEKMSAEQLHHIISTMIASGMLPNVRGLGRYPGFVHVDVRPGNYVARWNGSRTA